MTHVRVFGALAVLDTLGAYALWVWLPARRHSLLTEDDFVENLTALCFSGTFLAGLVFALRARDGVGGKTFALLAALGLVGALDEVSFGERLFEWSMPVVAGVKLDAVHDVLYLAYVLVGDWMRTQGHLASGLAAGAVLAAVARVGWHYRSPLTECLAAARPRPPHLLVLAFGACTAVALVLDLEIVDSDALRMLAEVLELNGALALFLACFAAHDARKASEGPPA